MTPSSQRVPPETVAPHPVVRRKALARVATTQLYYPDGRGALAATTEHIARAGAEDCDLVVFPEYHLGDIRVPGPEMDAIGAAAARHRVNVVVGAWEVFEDGTFANAAYVVDRDGKIVGCYNKAHAAVGRDPHSWPPFEDQREWWMQPGDGFPVFNLDFGRIGVMTCYDGYFPEVPHCLSLNGAEIIVWINGRHGSVEDYLVRSYMFTGFVHMVTANQSTGAGAMIGSYPDRILQISREANKDFFFTADLDLEDLRMRRAWGRMFHQRRPELYGALVQRHPIWENYPELDQPPTVAELEARKAGRRFEPPATGGAGAAPRMRNGETE